MYILGYLTFVRLILFVEICIIIYIYKKIYNFFISNKCVEYLKNRSVKFYYYILKLNEISLLQIVIYFELKIYNYIKWYQTNCINNNKKDSLLIPLKVFLNIFKIFYIKQIFTSMKKGIWCYIKCINFYKYNTNVNKHIWN